MHRFLAGLLALSACSSNGGRGAPGDVTADASAVGTVCVAGERLCDARDQVLVCAAGGTGYTVQEQCDRGTCAGGQCDCAGVALASRCAGRTCGDDGCGGTCGACAAGEFCDDGACAVGCPSEGTGRALGDVMASVVYTGDDGPWSLGSRCGAGGTVLVEGAIWCTGCRPAIARVLESLAGRDDVAVIALLGESQPGVPPTATDVARYRVDAEIPTSVPIYRDPLLAKTVAAVDHHGGGLPFFIVIDAQLVIRYVGEAGGAPDFSGLGAAVGALP